MHGISPLPEITPEQENWRLEKVPGMNAVRSRRDPVQRVQVGTYVAAVFRVTGYDPDCDGSLMARMEAVNADGEPTGWEVDCIGLYPETEVVLDAADTLHLLAEEG